MIKKLSVTLAASAVVITAAPVNAQSYNGEQYFLGEFFDKSPDCEIFYPEPVGKLPSLMAVDKICLPPPIAIIPKYGNYYARLMDIAINAGIRGDYNTALLNFRRARLIEISKDYLRYSNREALRGINGAVVAKRYQSNPHPDHTRTPQYFWYYWTGTGDRSNWGRSLHQ